MGLTQSFPHHENPDTDDVQVNGQINLGKLKSTANQSCRERGQDIKKTKSKTVEPLEKWTNDDQYRFEVISPKSDLSNPSQFRHRLISNKDKKDEPVGVRVQTSRYRTSKVCSKQYPIIRSSAQATNVPPPSKFYFQPEMDIKSDNSQDLADENVVEIDATKNNTLRKQKKIFEKANMLLKVRCLILKAKCAKAKERMSECWPGSDEPNEVKHQKTFDTQRTNSVNQDQKLMEPAHSKSSPVALQPASYLQLEPASFQPIWKEQNDDTDKTYMNVVVHSRSRDGQGPTEHSIKPYYVHNEDRYVDRLVSFHQNTATKQVKWLQNVHSNQLEVENTDIPVQVLFDSDLGMPVSKNERSSKKSTIENTNHGLVKDNLDSKTADVNLGGRISTTNVPFLNGLDSELNNQKKRSSDSRSFAGDIGSKLINFASKPVATSYGAENSLKTTETTVGTGLLQSVEKGEPKTTDRKSQENVKISQFQPQHVKNVLKGNGTFRRSLPPVTRNRRSTTSIASILQETYMSKYLSQDDSSGDDKRETISRHSEPISLKKIRHESHQLTVGIGTPDKSKSNMLAQYSPALSVDSICSKSSEPMLSDEVISNAAFLFSPSYNEEGTTKLPRKSAASSINFIAESSGFSISTFGSRSRVSSSSMSKPITIPNRSSACSVDDLEKADRRVRFSDMDVFSIPLNKSDTLDEVIVDSDSVETIPHIETKLSDLTDTMGEFENLPLQKTTSPSTTSYGTGTVLNSAPAEIVSNNKEDSGIQVVLMFKDEGRNTPTKPVSGQDRNNIGKEENTATTPFQERRMRWSYRSENGLDVGVTPLLRDRHTPHATNSPYLRFQEARRKFGGNHLENGRKSTESSFPQASARIKKEFPQKRRSSPIHKSRGSIIFARVTAMELWRAQQMVCTQKLRESVDQMIEARVQDAQETASDHSNLSPIQPLVQDNASDRSSLSPIQPLALSCHENAGQANNDIHVASPEAKLVAETINNKEARYRKINELERGRSYSQDASTTTDAYDDIFSQLVAPASKTGATDAKSETDSESDVFDEFLLDEGSEHESHPESGSVATVRQHREVNRTSTNTLEKNGKEDRFSLDDDTSSIVTCTTATTESASVVTVRQRRRSTITESESSTFSGNSQLQSMPLVFRENAIVKPSKLNHIQKLVPTQNPPVHAIKWRELAAAAQEKDINRVFQNINLNSSTNKLMDGPKRSSLIERDPNTFGRQ